MIALAVAAAVATPAWAEQADVTEHLGEQVPDAVFTDTDGHRVHLRDSFDGTHPVLLVLAYYECPQLCSLVLDGAVNAMKQLDWTAGDQYRVLTISFDDREHPDQAARKRAQVTAKLGNSQWPFYVGDAPDIAAVTDALGFHFVKVDNTIAHPAVAFVLTPDGTISRYLYGTDYPPRDLKLALLEASDGKTGSLGDKILLRCFEWDPSTRRYGLFVTRFMRIGAAVIFGIVLLMLRKFWKYERRRR